MSTDHAVPAAFSCREARQLLQELHDDEGRAGSMPAPLVLHLQGCGQCRRFQRFLPGLAPALQDAYGSAEATAPLALPARPAAPALTRAPFLVPALAAALAVAVGVPAALAARERAALRSEVSAFVDGLFTSSALEGVEVAAAGTSSGLLDGLGSEPWLVDTSIEP
jgi:hypothetical protein